MPYYRRMYSYLGAEAQNRQVQLRELGDAASEEDRVRIKTIKSGTNMDWIYQNNIGMVWEHAIGELDA